MYLYVTSRRHGCHADHVARMKDQEAKDLAVQSFLLELRSQLLASGSTELGRVTGSQKAAYI